MNIVREKEALRKVVTLIKEWTAIDSGDIDFDPAKNGVEIDLIQKNGDWVFAIEYKASGAAQFVAGAVEKLNKNIENIDGKVIPVVAVPFMGEAGRHLCEEKRVSWQNR